MGDVARRGEVIAPEVGMVMAEVIKALFTQPSKQLEQFLRRDFVYCCACQGVGRGETFCDNAVTAREQAATFNFRLAPRMENHFIKDFRANPDFTGHARKCTLRRPADNRTAGITECD